MGRQEQRESAGRGPSERVCTNPPASPSVSRLGQGLLWVDCISLKHGGESRATQEKHTVQVGAKFFAFVSLSSLPASSSSPYPLALSQELSSSTESIDNSFSSVSGARLGLGGRLPPWPHFLSVPRSSESLGPGWSSKVPFLPGRSAPLSQASQTWRSPLPCCQSPEPRLRGLS